MSGSSRLDLLYAAVSSPLGIVVAVSDYDSAATQLYRERKDSGDPDLDQLQLRRSPYNPEGEMWIVKLGAVPSKELSGDEDAEERG